PVTSPPGRPRRQPAAGSRELAWARRRARRLLVIGSALAVAAAVCIVVVARPWEGAPTALPANSVGLIDPAGGQIGAPVSVGSPEGLAYGDGSVWAVDTTEGTLSRINPATHAVIQKIPVGNVPVAIASGPSGVWVANQGDDTVDQINPATGKVTRRGVTAGGRPDGIAVGPDAVWVANSQDGTVTRI